MTRKAPPHRKIHIAIVEDSRHYREVLTEAFGEERDLEVVGAFRTAEAFFAQCARMQLDLVIMDINLPGISGIESVWRLQEIFPDVRVLMCTVFEDDEHVFNALRAGACGYILKNNLLDEIVAAIREVADGGAPMSGKIARKVLGVFHESGKKRQASAMDELTERENDILKLLSEGKTYPVIAEHLYISLSTVQTHVRNIYKKLHVHSRLEIISLLSKRSS